MSVRETAEKLIGAATERQRAFVLTRAPRSLDLELAHELKKICYEVWTTAPARAQKTSLALKSLLKINASDEVRALALWVEGIADLTKGRFESAVAHLDESAAVFRKIRREQDAANTQVAKLIALALLGKYTEAVESGRRALKIFEKHGDDLAAGKIEMNLSNILARRGLHRESEKYCLSAWRRFQRTGEKTWEVMAENDLANTYAELNDFRRAQTFYAAALENARAEKMLVTEAEIEASMGNLALFRGRFDEALRFLEVSRRKYEKLKMPHQTAIAELEIADIYLELSLADEALEIYGRVAESLRKMKLQGEEARARAGFGRAALLKRDFRRAKTELKKSARLYLLEKNPAGAASVTLAEAALESSRGQYAKAHEVIRAAERLLAKSENRRQHLLARWLHGDILLNLKKYRAAEKLLTAVYAEAVGNEQLNIAQICLNSLGCLAMQANRRREAESHFRKAVQMIEDLRAPLPAEEFRMAFLADKLAPFENLAKIYLSEKMIDQAFVLVEKARARTLAESLAGSRAADASSPDSALSGKLKDLREELNWFYSRLNRAGTGESEKLRRQAKKLEKQIAALMRRIESVRRADRVSAGGPGGSALDLEFLRSQLGSGRTLIEYVDFEGSLSAFVVTERKIEFFPDLASEGEILSLLEGLQFQFGALRYGSPSLGPFLPELKRRADHYLERLYDKLMRPLEPAVEGRDLVLVPVGAVNYVPFHALRDREAYLIERRGMVTAPSATVWQFLARQPSRGTQKALLIGFADERIPLVDREIGSLAELFPDAKTLTGRSATFENYTRHAPACGLLHMACHGQFRPDNPLFSSLHLADGLVTVRDICAQNLNAELVTLSACETGLNKIFPGDEILGLARGFLSAGAKSLVLSLWTVSDEATAVLMKDFYTNLRRGDGASAALAKAQRQFIEKGAHPYFWSPFIVIGK